MIVLRKQETDVDLLQKGGALLRRQVDLHPQRLQNICCPRLGGRRPVAVLCHRDARRCDDHGSRSRDIKRIRPVPACSDDLQHIHIVEQFDAVGTHPRRGCRDLVDRLSLHGQCGKVS